MTSRRAFLAGAALAAAAAGCTPNSTTSTARQSSPGTPPDGRGAVPNFSPPAAEAPPPAPAPPAGTTLSRIPYGKRPRQCGDLYLPKGTSRIPLVVTIHGGGWSRGVDLAENHRIAADLVTRGVAVWNIEYGVLGIDGGWPTTFSDVATAIDLLPELDRSKANSRLRLDRVVTFGASAGGQLAAWAASRHRIPAKHRAALGGPPRIRPHGAVLFAPVLDMVAGGEGADHISALVGGRPWEVADHYAAISPLALLPAGVPVVILHGDLDQSVPLGQSDEYFRTAKRLGDPAKLVVLEGVGHSNVDPMGDRAEIRAKALSEILALI